ncbi:uncharacterized protein LOC141581641 isoform X2 [Saimiri boliviensis]|uniref:uncharacterized protein LOC141581641 isoform X2 n=1 Tax=Saimiri boliviensis TaxID=27679 RepID=UPI003D788135
MPQPARVPWGERGSRPQARRRDFANSLQFSLTRFRQALGLTPGFSCSRRQRSRIRQSPTGNGSPQTLSSYDRNADQPAACSSPSRPSAAKGQLRPCRLPQFHWLMCLPLSRAPNPGLGPGGGIPTRLSRARRASLFLETVGSQKACLIYVSGYIPSTWLCGQHSITVGGINEGRSEWMEWPEEKRTLRIFSPMVLMCRVSMFVQ